MNYNTFFIVMFGIATLLMLSAIRDKMDERVDTHVYLPKHAQCAVKMMYFKDSKGEKYPAVREVCHWDNEYKQPKRKDDHTMPTAEDFR